MLRIAAIVDDTEAEGPGRRWALWVQGCPLRCPGCCNPELFDGRGGRTASIDELSAQLVDARARGVEGISVLGGEPFAQAEGVQALAQAAHALGLTVMIFTGYTRAELEARPEVSLADVDILVDGRYERELPEPVGGRRWIGSANQVVHRLSPAAQADPRLDHGGANTVELRLVDGVLTVNGWPSAADALRPRRRGSS